MTDPDRFVDVVTSTGSFEAVIRDALLAATRNGINPKGSWVFRNGEDAPDLEVLVTELEKQGAQ